MMSDDETTQQTLLRITKLERNIALILDKLNELGSVSNELSSKVVQIAEDHDELIDNIRDELHEQVRTNTIDIHTLNQYNRRESVEFCNIPNKIKDNELEQYVISLLGSIGVKVSSYNIVAVHRLGKPSKNRPRNVVCRFLNRKHAFATLKNKRKLKNSNGNYRNIYIIENLCPFNKRIFNALYKKKKEGVINSVWTYNGLVYCTLVEDGDTHHIEHIDELDSDLFNPPDEEDEEEEDANDDNTNNATSVETPPNLSQSNLPTTAAEDPDDATDAPAVDVTTPTNVDAPPASEPDPEEEPDADNTITKQKKAAPDARSEVRRSSRIIGKGKRLSVLNDSVLREEVSPIVINI